MICAVAFCPHPPVLVPQIAAGAAAEFAPLLAACDTAIQRLRAAVPDSLLIVGSQQPDAALRDFAPGVALPDDVAPVRPLSQAIARFLISRVDFGVPDFSGAAFVSVGPQGDDAVAPPARRTALLVMGDGSARRSPKGPGYIDERAAAFDEAIVKALGDADADALAAVDVALAAEMLVGGVGPWRAAARLIGGTGTGTGTGTGMDPAAGRWRGEVLYDDASTGVQYVVAVWSRELA